MTTDGMGVVSHAGTILLAELADRIGLTALLSQATDGLRERRAGHDPGRVLVDVAVAIADGAVTISDIQALADHKGLDGPAGTVASMPTIWRVLAGIDGGMPARIRLARAEARDRAWTAHGELTGSELPGSRAAGKVIGEVVIDLDATLVTAHSDKEEVPHPVGAEARRRRRRVPPPAAAAGSRPLRGLAGHHRGSGARRPPGDTQRGGATSSSSRPSARRTPGRAAAATGRPQHGRDEGARQG